MQTPVVHQGRRRQRLLHWHDERLEHWRRLTSVLPQVIAVAINKDQLDLCDPAAGLP